MLVTDRGLEDRIYAIERVARYGRGEIDDLSDFDMPGLTSDARALLNSDKGRQYAQYWSLAFRRTIATLLELAHLMRLDSDRMSRKELARAERAVETVERGLILWLT